jgi:hypothetical protein
MANNQINITVSAIDKTSAELKKVGNNLDSFAKKNEATFAKMAVV